MARFASSKLCYKANDLEEDCGPAFDDVDGCMLPHKSFCVAAGSSAAEPMISRGFGPKSLNNGGNKKTGNIFDTAHPMVLSTSGVQTSKNVPSKGSVTVLQAPTLRDEAKACLSNQTNWDKQERYESGYNSGLTESLNQKEAVIRQLQDLKITENNRDASQEQALEYGPCLAKAEPCVEDEAYYSQERCHSTQSLSIPRVPLTLEESTELMFSEQDKEGDTQAHLLLIHKQVVSFMELLGCVRNASLLNVQNYLLQSLLHLSVILNLPEVVRKLVSRGADVDVRDRNGNTPLHIACERGYHDCVIALTTPLDHREVKDVPYNMPYQRIPQDPDIKNYNGMTCLHLAAEKNDIKIVHHLITLCSADINAQEGRGGQTILHQAVEKCSDDLVKYLVLHRDLNLEASRYDGCTALQMAQGYQNHRMINILVNSGAETSPGNTSYTDSEDDLMVDGCDGPELPYDDFKIGGSLVNM